MTGRYRPRAHFAVDAFHFGGQPRDAWPDWLAERDDVTVYFLNRTGALAELEIANTSIGPQSARRGCWIVRHYGGRIGIFTEQAFEATYEPVSEMMT